MSRDKTEHGCLVNSNSKDDTNGTYTQARGH